MPKKKANPSKKAKVQQKADRKAAKGLEPDEDLEAVLDNLRREWELAHTVTEELEHGPPSRRANASLTACPLGNHIWCIGGEYYSEDGKAYFYNDTFRYSPEKDVWRKFVSPTCPGPRSAHAVAASPASGGKLFLFGGEFSSLHQTTFHHYRDFWCFDIQTHMWDRVETKIKPSARSGHRMAMWKHFIVLFGGFYDPGITTKYFNDLWVFDTQEYIWKQIEFKETELKPSPRSGFSFLPCAEGIVLHGGYCKEYKKGQRPVGVMLEDTWLLKLSLPETPSATTSAVPALSTKAKAKSKAPVLQPPTLLAKWERRKRPSDAFAPSLRSGCTMALWPAKAMGVMFGGVTDEDRHEETLESVFHNDTYGYQLAGKGRWQSFTLKVPKAKGAQKKKKQAPQSKNDDDDIGWNTTKGDVHPATTTATSTQQQQQNDDPNVTIPMARYNTMLAVLRNTLYIYGGIFERGSKEYTLDDFHSLQLDKLDRFVCLKESSVVIPPDAADESSSDNSDEDDSGDSDETDDSDENLDNGEFDEGEESEKEDDWVSLKGKDIPEVDEPVSLKKKKDKAKLKTEAALIDEDDSKPAETLEDATPTRLEDDALNTPLPGETVAIFFSRSRVYWTQQAQLQSTSTENSTKELRRIGFALAEERYKSYKPLLAELEKILAEAGLDNDEMRRGAASHPGLGGGETSQSRNRR